MVVVEKKPYGCCHPNCEQCPFEDCRWDGLESGDYQDDTVDKLNFSKTREQQLAKARNDRYRERHKEEIRQRNLDYYYAHHEECKRRSREYQRNNTARAAANKRKRWAENPEYYRQKQREYRAGKKAEAAAVNA